MNATARQSIRDLYHHHAAACGLKHVDGHGGYSIFEGTAAQWSALADVLASLPRNASVTAARSRVGWAVRAAA